MFLEKKVLASSGWLMLVVIIAVLVLSVGGFVISIRAQQVPLLVLSLLVLVVDVTCFAGLQVVNPNEGQVVQLAGTYLGTLRDQGFYWVNPLTNRRRVSLRVRNFESAKLKVNDHDGNPIEIAAVVVWKVVDTAEAIFHVDNYENFVHVQSEAALRNLATLHPYEPHEEGEVSLRGSTAVVADLLRKEIQDRLSQAGVEVLEARISHLAYAQEIAGAMLQRQQAGAIIAARSRIVQGAVSMVEMALEELARKQIVELDTERKATMVSNLLVVLCSGQHTQPVVNTGTLYQ
jgi:regulator of protease activity HflC (stomatin/prohibitin superfamily)